MADRRKVIAVVGRARRLVTPDAGLAVGVAIGTYVLVKGLDWQRKRRIERKLDQVLEEVT